MQKYKFNGTDGIIFSLADNITDKPNKKPQSDKLLEKLYLNRSMELRR